jgi:two-component system NtrC family sensor kinase
MHLMKVTVFIFSYLGVRVEGHLSIKIIQKYLTGHLLMIPGLVMLFSFVGLILSAIFLGQVQFKFILYFLMGLNTGMLILWACLSSFSKVEEAKDKPDPPHSLQEVENLKKQLMEQERIASLGLLLAGIAHEIKNPLNFINNFSDMNIQLLEELKKEIHDKSQEDYLNEIIEDIKQNNAKIHEHGKRAENTVKTMLMQARQQEVGKEPTDINQLLEEYMNLAYHGIRSQDNSFNLSIKKKLDPSIGKIMASPQSIGQVFLNIINNGCYAIHDKKIKNKENGYTPTMELSTMNDPEKKQVIIKIRDNGNGLPEEIKNNLFKPFHTTKPAGIGTGLGLYISHDIVMNQHHGKITVNSESGEFTEFTICLPI